jgi:hypothetical protein
MNMSFSLMMNDVYSVNFAQSPLVRAMTRGDWAKLTLYTSFIINEKDIFIFFAISSNV